MRKIIVCIIVVIVVCFFAIIFNQFIKEKVDEGKTIEEITGISLSDISYIKTGSAGEQNEYYEVSDFIKEYNDIKYKKNYESYGSTANIYFVCYDLNDEILFTVVEIGNQNKVFIKKGKFDINKDSEECLYQQK